MPSSVVLCYNLTAFAILTSGYVHCHAGCNAMYSSIFDSNSPHSTNPEPIRGFVVAAIEHSDGSACIARCLNADGSLGWIRSLDPVAYAAGTEMKSFEERRGQNKIRQAIVVNVY